MDPHRLAILADIHGTLPSLEKVLEQLEKDPPDLFIVAGDFVGGPEPHATLERLRGLDARFILGNGEVNMLRMWRGTAPEEWWTHRQFDFGRWIYSHLTEEDLAFLATLTDQTVIDLVGAEPIRVIHGSPWDVNQLMIPARDPDIIPKALQAILEDFLVFAHTHLPAIHHHNGKTALNPGSLGNNLDGIPDISYATLRWDGTDWHPIIHRLKRDPEEIKQYFIQTGFLEGARPLSRGILESVYTGKDVDMDFIVYAFGQAREAGYRDVTVVPDKIWLRSAKTFNWRFDI